MIFAQRTLLEQQRTVRQDKHRNGLVSQSAQMGIKLFDRLQGITDPGGYLCFCLHMSVTQSKVRVSETSTVKCAKFLTPIYKSAKGRVLINFLFICTQYVNL